MESGPSVAEEGGSGDFRSALRALYLAAGRPSARSISRGLNNAVSHTTIADLLAGRRIPSWAVAQRVIAYLGGDEAKFRHLWGQAGEVPGGAAGAHEIARPPVGRLLNELTDPFVLEVKPAQAGNQPPGLPKLQRYVARAHDLKLAEVVRAAAEGASGIAVLVGGSSAGKTRASWEVLELLRERPEPWRLWHPIDPSRAEAALRELPSLGPRTVIWLNEAQFYLDTPADGLGERVAAGLRELLRDPDRAPVLVLATLRPKFWEQLTARPLEGVDDQHAQARELLAGRAITVSAAFTGSPLSHDPRSDDEPYFFLSYAHMPRPVGDGAADPNLWIGQLFTDLSRNVRELAAQPPAQVGFMDTGIRHGTEWARTLSKQLAVCKTFVPLYSPHYFLSPNCGREWHAFCRRVRNGYAKGTGPVQQVIPAHWIPVPSENHPRIVREIQFRPGDFGANYAEYGFYPLTKMGAFKADYELAVFKLAREIVRVAETAPAPPGPALDYETLPNAFQGSDASAMGGDKPFHVVIAASRLAELPVGRSRDYYGATAAGWNPYVPDLVEPLAQYAIQVAQHEGHRRPQPFSLLEYERELLRNADEPPAAPAVLLIDPWVVMHPDCRRLLEAYDRMTKPWIRFVVAWSTKDDGLREKEGVLRDLLGTVLGTKIADGGRPATQVASLGIPTIEEMTMVLPPMIQLAGRHFLRRHKPPGRP